MAKKWYVCFASYGADVFASEKIPTRRKKCYQKYGFCEGGFTTKKKAIQIARFMATSYKVKTIKEIEGA